MAQPSTLGPRPGGLRPAAPDRAPGPGISPATLVWGGLGAVVALGLAAGGVMWWHYGTTIFFQVVAAGLAACF